MSQVTCRIAAGLFILWVAARAALLGQVSVSSWDSRDGDIKTRYFRDTRTTDIWAHIVPLKPDGDPNPTTFIFYARFPGEKLERPVVTVSLYVASDLLMYPTTIRQPVVRFDIDGRDVLDLTGPGTRYQLHYGAADRATGGPLEGVTAELDGVDLLRIAHAHAVSGTALGFRFALADRHLAQLREFAAMLTPRR